MVDFKKLLTEKDYRVVKRKHTGSYLTSSYFSGDLIEIISEGLNMVEAGQLKNDLNFKRTLEETKKFYFCYEKISDICPNCNVEMHLDWKTGNLTCVRCGFVKK